MKIKDIIPKLKEVKYVVGKDESLGLVSAGVHCLCFELQRVNNDALLYFPPNLKYWDEEGKKYRTDKGCGAISFGHWDGVNGVYRRGDDYLNLEDTKHNIEFISSFVK